MSLSNLLSRLPLRWAGCFLLLFSVAAPSLIHASDTTPPVLTNFTFSPTSVDTSSGPAQVTVTMQVTDNMSGVASVGFAFYSPSGKSANCGPTLISGTTLNGTWQCVMTLPIYSEAGTWTVAYVSSFDAVGNYASYSTAQLQSLGFPTALQVTSVSDTTPPVLTNFSFTPTSVDTSNSSAQVTVTMQVTDNLAGVASVGFNVTSPSGAQSANCGPTLISGTTLNGTWQCVMTLPIYSEAGTWTVYYVSSFDAVGNYASYSTAQLQSLGFPIALQVTSVSDTTPPVLTNFTFTPMSVNTTNSSAQVTVTMQVTDNLSGVASVQFNVISPSGAQSSNCGTTLVSGTTLNGTWQCVMTLPIYSEAGSWTVYYVAAFDAVGNFVSYYTTALQSLGFPTALQVIDGTSVSLTAAPNPSVYGQQVTFTATVVSDNNSIPTGTVNFIDGATTLGSATLDATGVATFATMSLGGGTHSITADYLGDTKNPPANSTALTQTVNTATTTTTLTSSANPVAIGLSVTFTATVSGANGGTPTGTITFLSDGYVLATAMLSAGQVAVSHTFGLAGSHEITATYSGDANFMGGTGTLSQGVSRDSTTTTVTSSPNPSRSGQPVAFTIKVLSVVGGPPEHGTVTLMDGTLILGTATVSRGNAHIVASLSQRGNHNIVASYAGDKHWQASKSAVLLQKVQ